MKTGSLQQRLVQLYKEVPAACRTAFFTTVILGYAVHLYAFTNLIPNADGIDRIYDPQQMTMSGRWFLHYLTMLTGGTEAPALIGLLTVLLLGLTAAFACDLLGIRNPLYAALAGGALIITIPNCYTFAFIFTASAYAAAALLAVLSIWTVVKFQGWKPVLIGACLLALSMGGYQTYLTVASSLYLMLVILRIGDGQSASWEKGSSNLKTLLHPILIFPIGAVLYYITLQIFLAVKGISLTHYRNMSDLLSLKGMLSMVGQIPHVYADWFELLFVTGYQPYVTKGMVILHVVLVILLVWMLVRVLGQLVRAKNNQGHVISLILVMASILLLPFSMNFWELLAASTPNMRYPAELLFLLILALAERQFANADKPSIRWEAVCALAMAGLLLLNAQMINRIYTAMDTAHRATLSFMTVLAGRIEDMPGYTPDQKVYLIGKPSDQILRSGVPEFDLVSCAQSPANTVLLANKHLYYYFEKWLNIPWEEPSEEEMMAWSDSAAFQAMPIYPADGSIQNIDGNIVVRLSDHYTPKQLFELEYEQRR